MELRCKGQFPYGAAHSNPKMISKMRTDCHLSTASDQEIHARDLELPEMTYPAVIPQVMYDATHLLNAQFPP